MRRNMLGIGSIHKFRENDIQSIAKQPPMTAVFSVGSILRLYEGYPESKDTKPRK
jgi:hypothetical protein